MCTPLQLHSSTQHLLRDARWGSGGARIPDPCALLTGTLRHKALHNPNQALQTCATESGASTGPWARVPSPLQVPKALWPTASRRIHPPSHATLPNHRGCPHTASPLVGGTRTHARQNLPSAARAAKQISAEYPCFFAKQSQTKPNKERKGTGRSRAQHADSGQRRHRSNPDPDPTPNIPLPGIGAFQ